MKIRMKCSNSLLRRLRLRTRQTGERQTSERGFARKTLTLVTAGAMLWGSFSQNAWAWQETTNQPPTTVPETQVEAEPLDSGAGTNNVDLPPQPTPTNDDFGLTPTLLETSIFSSPPANGYLAESTTTGTLINIPDIGLPLSVDVVTPDAVHDQQIINFTDALRDVSSAVRGGDGIFADRIFLRGLEVRSRDYRKNGFLDPTYTPRDFANIQRVEILKGPASVIYGSAAPSGTVNFITKKPVADNFGVFNVQPGSYGFTRYTADINGLVDPDATLLYRVNLAYENDNSFRDFDFTERHLIAPVLSWTPGADTLVVWESEFIENRRRGDTGIPALNGNAEAVSRKRYIGEPGNDFLYTEDYRTSLVMTKRFMNDWQAYLGAYTVFYEFPGSQTFAVQQVGPTQFFRLRQEFEDQESSSSLVGNLSGEVELAGMQHHLLFGTEQVYYDTKSAFRGYQAGVIDVSNPVYTNPPLGPVVYDSQFPVFRQVRHGYYFQDYLEVNEYLQFLAGVRFDDVDFTFERSVGPTFIRTQQRFERTTPRAGVVIQPLPDVLSLYFNYARSFNPPGGGGFGFSTDPRLPELGESFEIGAKAYLTDNLIVNVAGYHVTRDNVPFASFGAMGPVYFQVGRERAQGVEVEAIGALTDRWSVIGNWSYTDTRLTDPENPAIFGQRQRNVPLQLGNLWTRYNFIDNCTHRFGAALGLVAQGSRTANLSGSVILPAFDRWDGGLYYTRGPLDLSLYLENLFDRDYSSSSVDEFQIYPGAPFTLRVLASMRY